MPEIRSTTGDVGFILPAYPFAAYEDKSVSFTEGRLLFQVRVEQSATHDVFYERYLAVEYTGTFEMDRGVISGTFTGARLMTIERYSEGDYTSITGRMTVSDGIDIASFGDLQSSGVIAQQLILSGDDDLYGVSRGYGGNDTFHLSASTYVDGGRGFDQVVFDQARAGVALDLIQGGYTYTSIESYTGSRYADDMRGTMDADRMSGGVGHDLLAGRRGDDTLSGDQGNDTLIGSTGRDVLTGGSGADRFVYERLSDSTASAYDRITDFDRVRDIIDLQQIDANSERAGNSAFTFIGSAGFHERAGELRSFTTGSSTVIRGDVDGDGGTDFQIVLGGAMKLTSLDFVL